MRKNGKVVLDKNIAACGGTEGFMKKTFGIIVGALLIAVGVLFALDSLNLMKLNISFDGWWTVFIIAPSLYGLVTNKDKSGNLIVLAIGVYLLLAARGIIDYGMLWKLFVPTIIVVIGIKFIVRAVRGDDDSAENTADDADDGCHAVFGAETRNYSGCDIKATNVCAVFGGAKCNFTDVRFDKNSKINLFCIFGGADLMVPDYVEVKLNSVCLFGGISDKRNTNRNVEKTATLTIDGLCLFGGADIK